MKPFTYPKMKDPVNLIIFPSKRKRKIQRNFIFKSMTRNRQQCNLLSITGPKLNFCYIGNILHYILYSLWATIIHGRLSRTWLFLQASVMLPQTKSLGMQVPVPALNSRVTDFQSGPPGRSAAKAKVGSPSFSDSIEGLSVKWEQ